MALTHAETAAFPRWVGWRNEDRAGRPTKVLSAWEREFLEHISRRRRRLIVKQQAALDGILCRLRRGQSERNTP